MKKIIFKRLAGFFVDSVICFILTFPVMFIADLISRDVTNLPIIFKLPPVYQLITYLIYYFLSELLFKMTLGKKIMGLRLIFKNGVNVKDVAIRTVSRLIPFEPLSIFISSDYRMWHDKLSKSKIIIEKN